MKIADIKPNDIVDIDTGIAVSLWFQGCPFHCPECHNPGTWDFNGGIEMDINDVIKEINEDISASNIKRNFSMLGGEPLCPENRENALKIIKAVRKEYPDIKIFCWTGYTLEKLQAEDNEILNEILSNLDFLIDGPFVNENRDITLSLRGSSNQRVINVKETLKQNKIILKEVKK